MRRRQSVSDLLAASRFAILLLWVAVIGAAVTGFARAQATGFDEPVLRQVAPGVFVREGAIALMDGHNGGAVANIGFIVGAEAVAVIDGGGSPADGASLRAAIRRVTDLPIRYVVNTHMHPDHIFGNGAFVADAPVFVGHRRLPRAMASRGAYYIEANRKVLGAAPAGLAIIAPTLLVEDRLRLDLGGRRLLLTAHRTAHTDNDLTVFDERTGTLWAGDLLFVDHVPVVDGSLKGWLGVMRTLAAIPAERAIPGHGPAAVAWPDALIPQRTYLETLAADLRQMIAAGKTLREAAAKAGLAQREHWRLFNDFNARNATAGFAELEWE
jgi:quinoprotein relay system zinc metallohydrolase 2